MNTVDNDLRQKEAVVDLAVTRDIMGGEYEPQQFTDIYQKLLYTHKMQMHYLKDLSQPEEPGDGAYGN